MRRAIAVVRQRHPLAGSSLAGARPALERVAVGVESILRKSLDELVGEVEVALDHAQDPHLRIHREVRADVLKQRPRRMSEVPSVGRKPLDRRLACAQHALVIGPISAHVRILHDVARKLSVDRATKSIHAALLSAPWLRSFSLGDL